MKAFYLFIILFPTSFLLANMRAPKLFFKLPSYSLSHTKNLIIHKESLEFNCDSFQPPNEKNINFPNCTITAIYEIDSKNNANYGFEFIAPTSTVEKIFINELDTKLISSKNFNLVEETKEILRIKSNCSYCTDNHKNELYSLNFKGQLSKGRNKIQFTYTQKIGFKESSHSYTSSYWENTFYYELWPLKEWNLSDTFQLEIKFIIPKKNKISMFSDLNQYCKGTNLFKVYPFKPNLNKHSLDKIKSIGSLEINNEDTNFESIYKKTSVGENFVYSLEFTKEFPDRLECFYGEK
jgi:hypothetical protein